MVTEATNVGFSHIRIGFETSCIIICGTAAWMRTASYLNSPVYLVCIVVIIGRTRICIDALIR